MTREEAIELLKNMIDTEATRTIPAIATGVAWPTIADYHIQALEMAIQALEKPERNCEDCRFTFYQKELADAMEDDGK